METPTQANTIVVLNRAIETTISNLDIFSLTFWKENPSVSLSRDEVQNAITFRDT
jgi:hypothetical protein